MLHIKARHHSFHPGRKIHPAHLAVHHISPASFDEGPQAAAPSPHFDVVNERQCPPRDGSVLLLWRYCRGSSHGRGPCSDSGPLSLPSDSQRPTLRAVQMMGRWTLRSATGLHFRGVFPPGCSPSSSVARILYLREPRRPARHCLLVYTISDLIRIRHTRRNSFIFRETLDFNTGCQKPWWKALRSFHSLFLSGFREILFHSAE